MYRMYGTSREAGRRQRRSKEGITVSNHEDQNMTLTQRITAVLQQRKIMQERREKEAKREQLVSQITYLQQRKTGTPT